jgi:hypothetical protein
MVAFPTCGKSGQVSSDGMLAQERNHGDSGENQAAVCWWHNIGDNLPLHKGAGVGVAVYCDDCFWPTCIIICKYILMRVARFQSSKTLISGDDCFLANRNYIMQIYSNEGCQISIIVCTCASVQLYKQG